MNTTTRLIGRMGLAVALLAAACLCLAAPGAAAQDAGGPALEITLGHADFVDDAAIPHTVIGSAARWYLTPRLGVGPELVYMRGPRSDRDLFLTGNVTYDFITRRPDRRPLAVPYVVGGAGVFRHSESFGGRAFQSNEGTFSAGGGARVWLTNRVYVAGEARIGWELHTRYTAQVGVRLGP